MGFLDRFKNKKSVEPSTNNTLQAEQLPFEVEFGVTCDGRLQVDFYDKNADFKQFYDTTRLIVNNSPLNIAGYSVQNCIVSWYGHDDCQMMNKTTGKFESLRANEYRGVLAQIDVNLLQTDSEYCSCVMKELLNKRRVETYLEAGLEETPNRPCGKYVGGIGRNERGYNKVFSQKIGKLLITPL